MSIEIIKPKYVFSICVYCGSNPGYLPDYAQAAEQLGAWIGQHNGRLVYGGGRNGLMGVLADATLHSGGQVLGIIPQMLVDKEVAHSDCSELLVVPNMHERKALMMQNADAFLALPGGIGTFEELFEVWTWAQIGYHNKPLGLLNVAGYYDLMLQFFQTCVAQGFMTQKHLQMLQVSAQVQNLAQKLVQQAGVRGADNLGLVRNI